MCPQPSYFYTVLVLCAHSYVLSSVKATDLTFVETLFALSPVAAVVLL